MEFQNLPKYELESLKGNYINHGKLLCCIEHEDQYANILPVTFHCNNSFFHLEDSSIIRYGAKFKLSRFDDENTFQLLNSRFFENELFILNKFLENYNDTSEELYYAYGNETQQIEQEFLEIYDGQFNVDSNIFIPDQNDINNLLASIYERGSRHFYYIKSDNFIYGPFSTIDVLNKSVIIGAIHSNDYIIYKWEINNYINEQTLSFETNTINNTILNRIITNSWLDENESIERIKFLSDDQLFGWMRNKINISNKFTKSDFTKFKEIYETFQNSKIEENEKSLFSRTINILNESQVNKEVLDNFISLLPETKEINSQLDSIRSEIDDVQGLKESLYKEKDFIEEKINELKNRQSSLIKENSELADKQKEISEQQIQDIQNKNEELKEKIKEKSKLEEELSKLNKFENLRNLEIQIQETEVELRILTRNKNELDESINTLSEEFIETQKKSQEKLNELIKSKTHFDFISGRDFKDEEDQLNDFTIKELSTSFFDQQPESKNYVSYQKLLVGEIQDQLVNIGREYKSDFIANVLISIFQNTATIFAGLPGSGKTSLARIISKLFVQDERKRVEVAVSKGWSSQKDFIGFFNPLTKKFIPSNKSMYDFLKLIDFEVKEEQFLNTNLGFVLLDEANLSPIEHYWSSFYNLTDATASNDNFLSIDIGAEGKLDNANNIRFIGTINIDQTTEELSPRFIDRTNIIRISQNFETFNYEASNYLDKIQSLDLSYKDIIGLFNLNDFNLENSIKIEMEKESFKSVHNDYNKVKESFKNLGIIFSPRIDKAFIDYYVTAIKFMTSYKALDYFIAQRLLTKIDGQGEEFGENLKNIKSNLETILIRQKVEHSESIELLDMIISYGSRDDFFQTYNYFLIN